MKDKNNAIDTSLNKWVVYIDDTFKEVISLTRRDVNFCYRFE